MTGQLSAVVGVGRVCASWDGGTQKLREMEVGWAVAKDSNARQTYQ